MLLQLVLERVEELLALFILLVYEVVCNYLQRFGFLQLGWACSGAWSDYGTAILHAC